MALDMRTTANRPARVTAEYEIPAVDVSEFGGAVVAATPGVGIEVTFDLGDHTGALERLDRAVAQVKHQIASVARG